MSTIFRGWWNEGRCHVTIHRLFSTEIKRIGYRSADSQRAAPVIWGIDSPDCQRLAYHLLSDSSGQKTLANEYAQKFASEILSKLPADCNFALHADAIREWLFCAIADDLFPTFTTSKETANGQPVS